MTIIPVSMLQPSDLLRLGNNVLPAVYRDRWKQKHNRGRKHNRRRSRGRSRSQDLDHTIEGAKPTTAA